MITGGEVVDLLAGDVKAALVLQAVDHQTIGDGEGHDVHQPVVLQLEGADLENDRTDVLRQLLPPMPEFLHGPTFAGSGKVTLTLPRDLMVLRAYVNQGMGAYGKWPPATSAKRQSPGSGHDLYQCAGNVYYYGGLQACGKRRPHPMSIGRYVKRMQDHMPFRAHVIRRGDDCVEIRWNPTAADSGSDHIPRRLARAASKWTRRSPTSTTAIR